MVRLKNAVMRLGQELQEYVSLAMLPLEHVGTLDPKLHAEV